MTEDRNKLICITAEASRFGIQGTEYRHADKLSMQPNQTPLLVKVLTTGLT